MNKHIGTFAALGALLALSGAPSSSYALDGCAVAGPEYYEFPLVTTQNVPGTGRASGVGEVTFQPSPFGVSIGADGSYDYRVEVTGINLRPPRQGVFVAWAMTPELDHVVRLGALDEQMKAAGSVDWNKFLVAITLEAEDDPEATGWSGPIVMRGVSRSGLMHTMAGHGPFVQENCASYGFGG